MFAGQVKELFGAEVDEGDQVTLLHSTACG